MTIPNGLTPTLPSGAIGWLSKAKIGDSVYAIKDAELRAMLDTAAQKEAAQQIVTDQQAEGYNNDHSHVATIGAMTAWLEQKIAGLTGAMHFSGVVTPQEGETPVEALERALPNAQSGDMAIVGTKEFVFDGTSWKELGDEGVYATKAELETALQNLSIAGVQLGVDKAITADELKNALGLGAFAYANTGTGSLSTIDTASVTIDAITTTLTGTPVTVAQSWKSMDVTPAGSVTATAQANEISYDKFASASVVVPDASAAQYEKVSGIVITSGSEGTANYTPAGSVSVTADAAATFNPHTAAVATVTNAGTSYSLTAGSVSQAADTKAAFASEGVVAAMDTTDTEMLVFSAAQTAQAVTAAGAVTYTDPVLSGSLPTFGSADVVDSATITLPNFSGAFTGTGAVLSATANFANTAITGITTTTAALSNVNYTATTVTVPAQTITASFSGTTKSVTPEADGTASVAPANAQVTVAGATYTVGLEKTAKTITVTPVV